MVTIYKLYCIHTGEAYIGCTSGKLGKRMREHRCLLNKGRHSARRMQELWNKHGSSGFRLEPIESLGKEATVIDKRRHELRWMEFFDNKGLLLNHCKASFAPPDYAHTGEALEKMRQSKIGMKQTHESNEKRRLAQIGKPKGHGKKISAAKKGIPMKKKPCKHCGRLIGISNLKKHEAYCEKVGMI